MSKELSELLSLFKEKKYSIAEKKCLNLIKRIKPNYEIFNIYAVILFELNKYDEAIKYWKKTIELNPQYHFGYNNLGNAFLKKEEFKEALDCYHKAIQIKSDYYEAHHNKGNVLRKTNNFADAIISYDNALKIKSDYLPALKSISDLYVKQKNFLEAIKILDRISIYEPYNVKTYIQKADIYFEKNFFKEGMKNYQSAYDLNHEHPFLLGDFIHAKTKLCDWKDLDKDLEKLKKNIFNKNKSTTPFAATTLFDSPELLYETAKIWQGNFKSNANDYKKYSRANKKKIKLGFYSADFRTHAMGHLMVQMLESHDKSLFELHGFYFGPPINNQDLLQKRILNCFDSFNDINNQDDQSVYNLSKKLEIDIAIDMMGHTGDNNRFAIFLKKLAPIQINFLGYPGTSGSKVIDYIIADKVIIPEQNQKYFSEKIIYLPDTYQANEDTKKISDKNFTKDMLGLPNNRFIFCSFNSISKINPKIFSSWMTILSKAKNSVLWIMIDNKIAKDNLKNFASKRGIDVKRLIFTDFMPLDEHLKRLQLGDLILDTFPYNAHTTCSDALRVNLPLLTLKGEGFASRVAASLLNCINMNELVTESEKDYENLALKIYNNEDYLENIKAKIKKNKITSNLFNSAVFTKNIEKAYTVAHQNFLKGEPIKNIEL
ncbi:tetratricopeptide repeat protein [Candidatus Pelagibacter sp.]|nr:tetratricopeptide repeat protein [Candidatus Pelagibacter sp.]